MKQSREQRNAYVRIWRNWQTRTVQVRVLVDDVEVRILLSAPKTKQMGKAHLFCFFGKCTIKRCLEGTV